MSDKEEPTIEELYDDFRNMQGLEEVTRHDKHTLLQKILTDEQKAQIEEIDLEYADLLATVVAKLKAAEAALKSEVIRRGKSFKDGSAHHVTFNSGRVSWDGKALSELILEYPAFAKVIASARSKGQPFVTIKNKK